MIKSNKKLFDNNNIKDMGFNGALMNIVHNHRQTMDFNKILTKQTDKYQTDKYHGYELNKNSHSFNANLLRLAYEQPNKTVVVGKKMVIAGTKPTSARDWYDDFSKIPIWGDVRDCKSV